VGTGGKLTAGLHISDAACHSPNAPLDSLQKCKVHFKDGAVSEKHAELAWSGANWVVQDCQSSNGTTLNGAMLQPFRE
jgi:hypothetical protein